MDLKQLRAIVTVAETGSVTRAAQLLHIVQPAVTRQIKAIENELGVELFERKKTGMTPTPAGAALVERARRALTELERARAEITPQPDVLRGIVTLGLLESMSDLVAEPLVTAVAKEHPGIELRIQTAYSGHLQRWLDDGDLDLSLLYNLKSSPALNIAPVARERLWVAAPRDAGLSIQSPIDLHDLEGRPLVVPSAGHGLRTLVDEAAARAGFTPSIVVETNSMHIQKRLVLAGHGWTILPGIGVAEDIASGRLSGAPLRDPKAFRDVMMAVPRFIQASPPVDAVAQIMMVNLYRATRNGSWPSATWHGHDDSSEHARRRG